MFNCSCQGLKSPFFTKFHNFRKGITIVKSHNSEKVSVY